MFAGFYHRASPGIVVLMLLSLPWFCWQADQIATNNDIEIWFPEHSACRDVYLEFIEDFGTEEFILIAFELNPPDPQLVEAVRHRLEELPELRKCWSSQRMADVMISLGVSPEVARQRLTGLLDSQDGRLTAILAILGPEGIADRSVCTRKIHEVLEYCQLREDQVLLAGTPIFSSELNRLGSRKANVKYFVITLGICWLLLFVTVRDYWLTGLLFASTLWAICVSVLLIGAIFGETNLIMNSISVLVMIFTMAASLHYLHYVKEIPGERPRGGTRTAAHRAVDGLRAALEPTLLSTITTCIGVISLVWSDIIPVQQFAVAATLGSLVALFVGLGFTPAFVTLVPQVGRDSPRPFLAGQRWASVVIHHRRAIVCGGIMLLVVAGLGLPGLRSRIDPMKFLPQDSKVVADFERINRELTRVEGIEAVVDFALDRRPFVEQLREVREIERLLKSHPAVDHTLSLASFFPESFTGSSLSLPETFQAALNQQANDEFTAIGMHRWRISVRIRVDDDYPRADTLTALGRLVAHKPVQFTGVAPLMESARIAIFDGFWKSVVTACGLLLVAMMLAMRSIKLGLIAMIPNLWPVVMVFGCWGWMGGTVDIAMLLSGSIALGLAVDGTFHFAARRNHWRKQTTSAPRATRNTLIEAGPPLIQATLISASGLVGLTFSSFDPTVRFGVLMICLLLVALVGDLLLLPALFSLVKCRRAPEVTAERPPHRRREQPASIHREQTAAAVLSQ